MHRFMPLALGLLASALLIGCPTDDGPVWPDLVGGTLQAGAAAGYLDLPVGTPQGGYTGRDRSLGGESGPDGRDSDYRTDFVPSGGWQTRVPVDAIWLDNGEEAAVIVRMDLIYSFDGLTEEIGARLSAETGRDLTDSVFHVTNHSHSSYGPFSRATFLFFGGDFFREEIFQRMVQSAVDVAMEAHATLQPAAIGLGIDEQFDPIGEDHIFRDRRTENDHLLGPEGEETGPGWKDARASMLRVDGTDGTPIAAMFAFGIHGTVMGGDNALISVEAPGHIPLLLNERYGGPVWMHAQGAGGDSSPSGRWNDFARMEYLGEVAADRLLELYDSIELTSEPLILDPVQRYVHQGRDIRVTRNDTVDLHYMEWDPSWADYPYRPDMQVWDAGGDILSPLDEFWVQYGAILCGEPDIDISIFGLDVDLPMYASCLDIDLGFSLFRIAFQQYIETRDDYPLPLPESRTSLLGGLGLSGLPVTRLGEGTEIKDVVFAFAPGEATTLWTQFLRYRARTERELPETVVIGYSMDHEGYLLTVDDWLQAGYESTIMVWGPLQGEYLLEQMLSVLEMAASPVKEDEAYPDHPTGTWYPDWDTPFVEPDVTPDAGATADPLPDYLYTRDGVLPATAEPATEVARIQGVAGWAFWGSDPATGLIDVEIERDIGDGWQPLLTPAGNPVSDALPDIIVTYTPYPLVGTGAEPDPVRDHLYFVEWQAVETWGGLHAMPGLALGSYRFVARGGARDPADTTYPYDTIPWDATSEPFEIVPADLGLSGDLVGDTLTVTASYAAAGRGYRNLHLSSDPRTATPLVPGPDGITVDAGDVVSSEDEGDATRVTIDVSTLDAGIQEIVLDDGWGNTGTLEITIP
jgi:neutral ceramidase